MNKFLKSATLLASALTLASCGVFNADDEHVGGAFEKLVKKEQEWSDTIQVVDNLGIKDSYAERLYSHKGENFDFKATGSINDIFVGARIECGEDGGKLYIFCGNRHSNGVWFEEPEIVFKDLEGSKMTNEDGYTIRMLDSMVVNKKTYKNVLEFDASDAKKNECSYDKFYIAATKGLLRIDLKDTITIERKR